MQSNQGKPKQTTPECNVEPRSRARARVVPPRRLPGLARPFPRSRAFPRPSRVRGVLKFSPAPRARTRAAPDRPGRAPRRTVGPSAVSPCAPTEATVLRRVIHPLAPKQADRRYLRLPSSTVRRTASFSCAPPHPAIRGRRGKPGVRPAAFPDQGALHLLLHLR
jgi:hypothetical protein